MKDIKKHNVILCIVILGICLLDVKAFAANRKYVKKLTINTDDIVFDEGESVSRKYNIKVVNKASKKIQIKVHNKKVVEVSISGNEVYFVAKSPGKTAVTLTTKAKNNKGKKITKKIYVKVEPKEKELVYFKTYAESGYIYVGDKYNGYWAGMFDDTMFTDNLGKTYKNGINWRRPNFSISDSYVEYRVDEYNYLKGTIILNYSERSEEKAGYMKLYGDGELIYTSPEVKKGADPFEVNLDISGIRVLRIEFEGQTSNLSFVEPKVGK